MYFFITVRYHTNFFSKVCSQSSCIRNIKLRKPLSVRKTKIEIDTVSFQTDLALAYDSFGYYASLISKTCNFYEHASYLHNTQNNEVSLNLNTNDVVTIQVADYGESYAIIKGIFKHKSNDGYYYPFIYVNWFKDIHRNHNKLDCPLYSLCYNNTWHKIFPLTVVDGSRKVHFVHDCDSRCNGNNHSENIRYLKNSFFFKAI